MLFWLKVYLATLAVLVALDAAWLTSMRGVYKSQIGDLLSERVNWTAALIFYFLFAIGLVMFVIADSESRSWTGTLARGAILGLVAYGTYDLTNLATLARWPVTLTVLDMAWGAALSALVAGAGKGVVRWLLS